MAGKMSNKIDDAIPSLRQSLQEEEKMFGWLRANAPAMFAKLWPQIEESLFSSTSSKIKTTTENVDDINQTFKCESCNETFNSRQELKQHTIQNHESK
jgi:formylmethanofuran dehydrogenase subunit E